VPAIVLRVDSWQGTTSTRRVTMADEGMVALRDALGKIMESEHAGFVARGCRVGGG
jgi:hypothetical protein